VQNDFRTEQLFIISKHYYRMSQELLTDNNTNNKTITTISESDKSSDQVISLNNTQDNTGNTGNTMNILLKETTKLLQSSVIANMLYEHYVKIFGGKSSLTDLLNNKNNIKYGIIATFILFASTLIGILSYFLFYVTFFFSCLKCILWLFEKYKPSNDQTEINQILNDKTQNDRTQNNQIRSDQKNDLQSDKLDVLDVLDVSLQGRVQKGYVSEKSSDDVLEYYIVPIFIVLFMQPVSHIPIPFVSFITQTASVVIAFSCMANKTYRRKFCVFMRDLFTNKHSRDKDGNFIQGFEGEFHRLLQTLCYTIECINCSIFNTAHNPVLVYNKINDSDSIFQSIKAITNESKTT
jgi:hypothetical protein